MGDTKLVKKSQWIHVAVKGYYPFFIIYFKETLIFPPPRCITRAMNDPDEPLNSVSMIDKVSRKVCTFWKIIQNTYFHSMFRVIFPLSYLMINIVYWNLYFDMKPGISVSTEDNL